MYADECFVDLCAFGCFVSTGDFSGYYAVPECSFGSVVCGFDFWVFYELEEVVFLFEEVFYEFPAFVGFVGFLGECCFHVFVEFFDVFVCALVVEFECLLVCVFQDFMDSFSITSIELGEFFGVA